MGLETGEAKKKRQRRKKNRDKDENWLDCNSRKFR
jgi:hypothetical protein